MLRVFFIIYLIFLSEVLPAQNCRDDISATTPDNRFLIHNDGTTTDLKTELMWQRCFEGSLKDFSDISNSSCINEKVYSWKEALMQAQKSNFSGYTDWRLPNIKELASIVERKCTKPAFNQNIFLDDDSQGRGGIFVWTSSPFYNVSNRVWFVRFDIGLDQTSYNGIEYYVRLVRNK